MLFVTSQKTAAKETRRTLPEKCLPCVFLSNCPLTLDAREVFFGRSEAAIVSGGIAIEILAREDLDRSFATNRKPL